MYAYVMRPETLPPSYYKFIVRSGTHKYGLIIFLLFKYIKSIIIHHF